MGRPEHGLFSGGVALGTQIVSFGIMSKAVLRGVSASGGGRLAIFGAGVLILLFVICVGVAI